MKTIRQQIISRLSEEEMDVREISQAIGIREKEVYEQLPHIARTLKPQGKKLMIRPSRCKGCGYVFKDRKRFTPPSRCPRCKGEWIESPAYRIS